MAQKFRSFGEQTLHYFDRPHEAIVAAEIDAPAAWRGADLRDRVEDWRIELTNSDIGEIANAISHIHASSLAMMDIDRTSFPLPTLSSKIKDWRRELASGRGFVLVRGLPVDEWGADDSAIAFWGLGHHLGVPGAQNPDNDLLGRVVDYGEERTNPNVRRYRTSGNIDFHCDAADVVGLLCLHEAKTGGQSRIASSVTIFNEILRTDTNLANRLFQPFKLDRRGEQNEGDANTIDIAPCCYSGGDLRTFYHSEYFRSASRHPEIGPLDPITQRTLDLYDQIAADPDVHLDMWLERGDMQFVSNHANVHARTEYEDYEERERKRLLLRLWLSLE